MEILKVIVESIILACIMVLPAVAFTDAFEHWIDEDIDRTLSNKG